MKKILMFPWNLLMCVWLAVQILWLSVKVAVPVARWHYARGKFEAQKQAEKRDRILHPENYCPSEASLN